MAKLEGIVNRKKVEEEKKKDEGSLVTVGDVWLHEGDFYCRMRSEVNYRLRLVALLCFTATRFGCFQTAVIRQRKSHHHHHHTA